MAADATEIERLLVRLVGDNKMYIETLNESKKRTEQFTEDAQGRFRDMQGKFVSAQHVLQAQAGATLHKINALGGGFKTVGDMASKAGESIKRFGGYLSLRVTAPLTGIGIAAAKTFGGFEQVLGQMQGLAGVGAEEIDGITENLKALAIQTGKGPTELAESLYNIRSSGVSGKLALDTLEVSAKAAAAGLGETRVVSDAVTSVLNAYGAENVTAAKATDILVAAVREGKAEADEIAPVMGRLVPVASAMGIEFQEVAGVMAVMSRTGSDAAEASTSIGAILNTLLKPSKNATDTLRSAGLSMGQLRDVAKGPGGLIEVMRILDRTFGENEEALSQIVPETRAFRGVMNVLAQDAGLVDGVMKNVADSAGATESAFDAGAETLQRKWSQAMSELKTGLIELGATMKPALIAIFEVVREAIDWFKNLDNSTKQYIVTAGVIAAALGPVLIVLGSITSAIGSLVGGIGTIMTSVKALLVIMKLATVATGAFQIALVAGLIVAANKVSRAFHGMNGEIALGVKNMSDAAEEMKTRFDKSMESLADLPVNEQAEQLTVMRRNLQQNLEANRIEAEKHRDEIKEMEGNFLGSTWDAHSIELAKGHIDDAKNRAAILEEQLKAVNAQMDNLGKGGAGESATDTIMGKIRPEAIEAFTKELETQLQNLEIENTGKLLGASDEDIARQQAYVALEKELALTGASLNEEERNKLFLLADQTAELEKQLETRKKEEKAAEEAKKKLEQGQEQMATKAAQVIEASMTPMEELKKELDEIRELHRAGALTLDEATKAGDQLVQDFAEKQSVEKASAGEMIKFGSAESEAARLSQNDKSAEKGIWKMVEQMDVEHRTQEEILAALRGDQQLVSIEGGV